LSIGFAGVLAIIGGAWLFQNKDWVFRSPSRWMVDEALKNQEEALKLTPPPKFDFGDTSFMKGVTLESNKYEDFERKYGKFSTTPSPNPTGKAQEFKKDLKGKE
jgi:hypothetical protein